MSAERLRAAAALMRERADLPYVKGEWEVVGGVGIHRTSSSARISHPWHAEARAALYDEEDERALNEAIAEHIASWHPVVALAVADWLDDQAEVSRRVFLDVQRPSAGVDQPPAIHYGDVKSAAAAADHHTRHALAVANAYLGATS